MVLATWWFEDRQPSLESVMGLRRTRGLERDLSPVLRRATTTRNAVRCVLVTYASPRRDADACCFRLWVRQVVAYCSRPGTRIPTSKLHLKQTTLPPARICASGMFLRAIDRRRERLLPRARAVYDRC